MSFAVEADLSTNGVENLRLLPVYIESDANPRFVPPESAQFQKVLNYLQTVTDAMEFATGYAQDGDTIRPFGK